VVAVMAFEVYKARGEKAEKPLIVSLSKNSIVLNKIARERLGKPEFIELAYDPETSIIRIKASDDGTTVKKTKVFARGFFKHFDINAKGRFKAHYNEETNALYVILKE
jgi:hypothetical protein